MDSPGTTPRSQDGAAVARGRGRTPSCLPCRERHLKCSKQLPECTNCRNAKHIRHCTYETARPLRFRESRRSRLLAPDPTSEWSPSTSNQRTAIRATVVYSPPRPPVRVAGRHSSFHQAQVSELCTQYSPDLLSNSEHNVEELSVSAPNIEVSDQSPCGTENGRQQQDQRGALSNKIESDVFAFYAECLGSWVCCADE